MLDFERRFALWQKVHGQGGLVVRIAPFSVREHLFLLIGVGFWLFGMSRF